MLKKRRFEKMYKLYADDIFKFIFVHTRDIELAEDLTADTFTKAWQNIDTFDGAHERGWLYKIAQNKVTDHWRKKKAVPLSEEFEVADDKPSTEEKVDTSLEAQRVHKALATLPEQMRSVVALRFMQGYSVKQTAEALHMSESNVRVVQFRALKKLEGVLS